MDLDVAPDLPIYAMRGCYAACEILCQRCFRYASLTDEVPDELTKLITAAVELFGGLGSLQITMANPAAGGEMHSSGVNLIIACDLTFERIIVALDGHDAAILERERLSEHLWPFTKTKTLRWVAEMERHKTTLSSLINNTFASRLLSGKVVSSAKDGEVIPIDFGSMLDQLGNRWSAWSNNQVSQYFHQRMHDMADMIALAITHLDREKIIKARFKGLQVLSLAILIGNDRFIDVCVDKFESVDIRDDSVTAKDTPLELAAERGVPRRIFHKMLAKSKAPNSQNDKKWSAIHTACERGHREIVEELLDAGVDVNMRGYEDMNPLLMTASNQQAAVAELLLARGADIHAVNKHHWNSCHFAANNADLEFLAILKKTEIDWNCEATAAVNGVWHSKMRPIHFAACLGSRDAIKYLFDNGLVEDLNCATQKGLTAVHFAVIENNPDTLKYLLSIGADSNATWLSPYPTPLHLAARFGPMRIAELLLEHKADCHARNSLGNTPEVIANRFHHRDIAAMLKKHKLNSTENLPTPFYLPDTAERNPTITLLRSISSGTLEACKNAINQGADLNLNHLHSPEMRAVCCTPLLKALRKGRPGIAKLLIQSGASIQGKSCKVMGRRMGYTAMHYAARFGYSDVLRLLVERYSELEPALNDCPVHPIHLAAAFGHELCVRLLLSLEAVKDESKDNDSDDHSISTISSRASSTVSIIRSRASSISVSPPRNFRPVYPRISLEHIETATLDFYNLPWEYYRTDASYVVILKHQDESETDVLFEHTKQLRARRAKYGPGVKTDKEGTPGSPNLSGENTESENVVKSQTTKRVSPHPLAIIAVQQPSYRFPPFHIESMRIFPTYDFKLRSVSYIEPKLIRGTPLHIACISGNRLLVDLLLDEASVPVDILDDHFMTPLHHASDYAHNHLVDFLLTRGAHLEARNDVLETPLLVANDNATGSTVEHLVTKHGANTAAANVLSRDNLVRAVEEDNSAMLAFSAHSTGTGRGAFNKPRWASSSLLESAFSANNQNPTLTYLLNAASGEDLAAITATGGSALHTACAFVSSATVKRMLRRMDSDSKARVLACKSALHGTPLYIAAASGNVDIVRMLLDAGAGIHPIGGDEGTPIMVAARYGRIDVVRELLARGSEINCMLESGEERSLWEAAGGEGDYEFIIPIEETRGRKPGPTAKRKRGKDDLNAMRLWMLVGRFIEAPRLLTESNSS